MKSVRVRSLLDNDLYKFTMQMAVLELYPNAIAEYSFTNRRKSNKFPPEFKQWLEEELMMLSELQLELHEKDWFKKTCPFLKPQYIEYLANYQFNPKEVAIEVEDGDLKINISGPWRSTILWEVPLMALISDIYFSKVDNVWSTVGQEKRIQQKGEVLCRGGVKFADFGTRRRRSYESQRRVIKNLVYLKDCFVGTSNVHFAQKFDIKPIGTMAHEWIMGHSVLSGLRHANRYALEAWHKVYHGLLGIALTDTYGTEAFFADFDTVLARQYDGVRHDSGDPFNFARRVVEFYKSIKIPPETKTIVFSDSLNPELAVDIKNHCKEIGIRCSFGIGTNFTNDYQGSKALNMVIKLRSLDQGDGNSIPVVKLSDDPSKATGDADAIRVAKWTFLGTPL